MFYNLGPKWQIIVKLCRRSGRSLFFFAMKNEARARPNDPERSTASSQDHGSHESTLPWNQFSKTSRFCNKGHTHALPDTRQKHEKTASWGQLGLKSFMQQILCRAGNSDLKSSVSETQGTILYLKYEDCRKHGFKGKRTSRHPAGLKSFHSGQCFIVLAPGLSSWQQSWKSNQQFLNHGESVSIFLAQGPFT